MEKILLKRYLYIDNSMLHVHNLTYESNSIYIFLYHIYSTLNASTGHYHMNFSDPRAQRIVTKIRHTY